MEDVILRMLKRFVHQKFCVKFFSGRFDPPQPHHPPAPTNLEISIVELLLCVVFCFLAIILLAILNG